MSLLLLDRSGLRLKSEGGSIALYDGALRRGCVPIQFIDRCVIHGVGTELDSGVLLKLADAGATTVIMSPRSPRRVALVLGGSHNDAAVRIAQAQRVMDSAACQRWAHALVRAKVARQLRLIGRLMQRRPDARKPLFDAQASLQPIWQSLRQADPSAPLASAQAPAPNLASLRGLEGAAARAYFAGLAAVMPPALGFAGRNRRPPRDPVNVCLSLGYTLLHTHAVAAAHSAGLDPLLGFYHRPSFGRESLASDLIEPLRAAVDEWVWALLRLRALREEHFSTAGDACMMGKAGRAVFYAEWEKAQKPWARWLRARTRALAAELRSAGLAWVQTEPEDDPC